MPPQVCTGTVIAGFRVESLSNRDGEYLLYTMNADGTGVRRLTNGEPHAAAWGTHP